MPITVAKMYLKSKSCARGVFAMPTKSKAGMIQPSTRLLINKLSEWVNFPRLPAMKPRKMTHATGKRGPTILSNTS